MAKFKDGDRVEGGTPGTDDYDTGYVVIDAPDYIQATPHHDDDVWVCWDSGVDTWAQPNELRLLEETEGAR